MKNDFDVVIIGAGPAGAVAAARLLQDGLSVLVLEKMKFPRFVIGESLLPKCMDYLEKVDLLTCIQDQNFQIKSGVTFYHEDEICDFLFKDRSSEGWDYTYQVKRADFDWALIQKVEAQGANVQFNCSVEDVQFSKDNQVVSYTDEQGVKSEVQCRFVMDASGYGRVLPRLLDIEKAVDSVPRGAIFAHINDPKRSEKALNNIFVHSFNDNTAWIWSIPFSDGTASVGVVGDAEFVNSCEDNESELFKELVQTFPGLEGRFAEEAFLVTILVTESDILCQTSIFL